MGHEYAHILSGHLSKNQKSMSLPGIQNFQEKVYDWEQKLEADRLGMELMLQAMLKHVDDLALRFWGVDFFFSCLEIVERGISVLRTGNENNIRVGSHPPPQMRREFLRTSLRNAVPQEGPALKKRFQELADQSIQMGMYLEEEILGTLWKVTLPTLRQLYEKGQRPATKWQ